MEKPPAESIRDLSLKAIVALSSILVVAEKHCSVQELNDLRRAVGRCVANIQKEILEVICAQYPELDDLK